MTVLYSHPCFLAHNTGAHPECAERLRRVTSHLAATRFTEQCTLATWEPATLAQISRVHAPKYAQQVANFAAQGGGQIESDTWMSERSYQVALDAAGAVCNAVTCVVQGAARNAICLVRPPGHHALPDSAMGFCLFNNVAVGALHAVQQLGLERVLIVDWDVHHGNGTQNAFWDNGQVAFLSLHRWPFYPGTGSEQETGAGRGAGWILNIPTPFGTPREKILDRFRLGLERLAAKVQPQLVLVSAGFDAHREDPIGSLGLEVDDFRTLSTFVLNVAATYAGGKLVSVLEGGYNVNVLPLCVAVHLEELLRCK